MASITLDELHAYHAIDREVFSRMVICLARDPAESLLVMALWLWLEDKGFPNIISKLARLSKVLVNAIADEATLCLRCLELDSSLAFLLTNGGGDLPLTAGVMDRNISLDLFRQNKFSAIAGVKSFLNTVCCRIFTDILSLVLYPRNSRSLNPMRPMVIPGFPHSVFGSITVIPRTTDTNFLVGGLWGWDSSTGTSIDDRTMFLTFSRGFPVTREEISELFERLYGDCVVDVDMPESLPGNEQPLFAKMVLDSVGTVDRILNGRSIAKFRINGKHIWARKYERRE